SLSGVRELRADGTVLITGGLGGLGIEIARWLVAQGAGHVVLAGRHSPDDRALATIRELGGARVESVIMDVADEESVKGGLRSLSARGYKLSGVIHAAVVLEDGVLTNQDVDRLRRTFRPKVDGAWNLHLATQDLKLDFFV